MLARDDANMRTGGAMRRRLLYLMLFRVVVISIVLGVTSVLYWLSDIDVTAPAAISIYGIIAGTYLLTMIYALGLRARDYPPRLCDLQLAGDLIIAALLVHVTGGAQSAYTFFFPFAIVGSALVRLRQGVYVVAPTAAALFVGVAWLGWMGILIVPEGAQINPTELTTLQFIRSISLNLAAMTGVAALAINLSGQLEQASVSLETQRSAAADLLSLHKDIIRSLTSGLITVDRDDRVITFNRAACEILRKPANAVDRAMLSHLFPGLRDKLEEIGPLGNLPRGETHLGTRQGELCIGFSISPLFNHKNQALGRVMHFQDLTDLRQMEVNVKHAERLAVIGRLAAGVAHEIRNPLAAISGSIELLRPTVTDLHGESRALMDIVTREIDRLDGMISELLDYANPRPLKKMTCDMAAIVRDTLAVFRQDPRFEAIALKQNIGDTEPCQVAADPEKMRQVLWNLLRNAAEAASESGGQISVELENSSPLLVLKIGDNGPGIAKDVQEKVFDPFFTTKNRGTGLGLATVHSIVADHGGHVRVDSEPGVGSVFTVELPRGSAEMN